MLLTCLKTFIFKGSPLKLQGEAMSSEARMGVFLQSSLQDTFTIIMNIHWYSL
jgi:hypothetical protein